MPGRQLAVGQEVLHAGRQAEQAQRVGHRRATLADALGDLVVGQLEVLDQLGERRRLLQRGEVLAVEVLDQRLLDGADVVGRAHHRRDRRQPGPAGRPPASLAGDQLVALRPPRRTSTGWSTPSSLDRGGQLAERVLVEVHPRLVRVGDDVVDRQLDVERLIVLVDGLGGRG